MSVAKILSTLSSYATFERHPLQAREAYDQLLGYAKEELTEAFNLALKSDDDELIRLTLELLRDYYLDCTETLPEVRRFVFEGGLTEYGMAISILISMQDRDPLVTAHLRHSMKSSHIFIRQVAASYLLRCHNCSEALECLEEIAKLDEAESLSARYDLSEWKFPVREYTSSDSESVQRLFEIYGKPEAKVIRSLRDGGYFEHELVAIHQGEVVGHAAFSKLSLKTTEPVAATLMLPLYVHPDYRLRKIGMRLFYKGLGQCEIEGKKLVFTFGQAEFLEDSYFDTTLDIVSEPSVPDWMVAEIRDDSLAGASGIALLPEPLAEYFS